MTKKLNTLFYVALLVIIAITVFGCSNNEAQHCKTCRGQFVNIETEEYFYQDTDCNRVPPDGYVFVKCMTINY
jgi:hypothetical protein